MYLYLTGLFIFLTTFYFYHINLYSNIYIATPYIGKTCLVFTLVHFRNYIF